MVRVWVMRVWMYDEVSKWMMKVRMDDDNLDGWVCAG